MRPSNKMGFKFIDCVAEYVTDDGVYEAEHPDKLSKVSGLIGGALQCDIYPEQLGLPATKEGERITFHVSPKVVLESCVQAVARDRMPPEYVI